MAATDIDVVIPTYNQDTYILRAIESAATQTLLPRKIFVIDDGSHDKTEQVVTSYKETCPIPIEYIKKENGGPNSARNVGIRRSTSGYIAFLDADDEWYPHKLEEQVKVFQESEYANTGVAYCQYEPIDENSNPYNKHTIVIVSKEFKGNIFSKLLKKNEILGSASAVLIKRECFEKAGLFDENLRAFEDWDMWLRIAEAGYSFDYSPQTLVKIRFHGQNAQKDKVKMFKNEIAFYNKWIEILSNKNQLSLVPRRWALGFAKRIVTRLPHLDFIKLASQDLSSQAKKVLWKTLL